MNRDRRDADRNRGFARAGLVPSLYGYGADVSARGFRAVFRENPRLAEGDPVVPVLSFSEIDVEPFPLPSEVRWIRQKEGAWEIGFSVRMPMPEGPAERDFFRIYEYYRASIR
ncbi:MAG: PilZ domain-containing protein [Treponema sp.]|nr:PilZ domain-containing protein [Treponema sp.]